MRTLERGADRPERAAPRPLAVRLLWFVGIWTASVAVLGAVAWVLRLWIA